MKKKLKNTVKAQKTEELTQLKFRSHATMLGKTQYLRTFADVLCCVIFNNFKSFSQKAVVDKEIEILVEVCVVAELRRKLASKLRAFNAKATPLNTQESFCSMISAGETPQLRARSNGGATGCRWSGK